MKYLTGGTYMKSHNRNTYPLLLCILLILLTLAGCGKDEAAETTIPRWESLRKKAEYLTVAATKQDFSLLEECINLKYLDLTGSTCYEEILAYANAHPQVELVYTAPLGNLMLSNSETHAVLKNDAFSPELLISQMKYLPRLTHLDLPKTTLSRSQLDALRTAYPDLQLYYTVELLGKEYDSGNTEINLSNLTSDTLAEAAEKLALLPAVTDVQLSERLSMADVKFLMEQFPEIHFQYTFDLFGKTLSTEEERVEYTNVSVGNSGADQIRAALDIMPKCTYFKLENCGLDNEVLASIQADYPNTKIVWRVSFGGQYSLLTDETTLRTVYGVENSHNAILKYCTSLKYIDMGHNTTLTDISFASYMPDLEILILSGSSVKNVDALANCKNLVFLEMANCLSLEDISGLKDCKNLRFLNIGFSRVTDLSPIEDLPLERFVYLGPKIDKETQAAFEESHPNCWVRFTGSDPLSLGWKYDDVGITRSEYYKFIREVFNLDDVDRRLAQQAAAEEEKKWQQEQENQGNSTPETNPTPSPEPTPEPPPTPQPDPPSTPDAAPET